ncbi:MAG TPA: alpha/beta fold hydrolase [Acidobacteriota bacterium]|nr:alpha/beta fold hydrolase [Acidobacteriota bacterium]
MSLLQFLQYDKNFPLNARVVEESDMEICTREKIVLNGPLESRVPGYLAIPKKGSQPHPCVLLLHSQEGSKSSGWHEGGDFHFHFDKLTRELLSAGFAVCALDAPYHGERSGNNDYQSVGSSMVQNQQFIRYRDMVRQSTIEYRILLDYLTSRSEVDMARIGVLGCSMGGAQTFLLTAAEPRIKTAIAASVPTSGPWISEKNSAMALQNYIRGIGDRPFLLMMGKEDGRFLPVEAEHVFVLIESPVKKLIFYDCGHFFTDEYVIDAIKWFKDHL